MRPARTDQTELTNKPPDNIEHRLQPKFSNILPKYSLNTYLNISSGKTYISHTLVQCYTKRFNSLIKPDLVSDGGIRFDWGEFSFMIAVSA